MSVLITFSIRYENITRSLTGKRWRRNVEFKKYIHITTSGCIIYTLIIVLSNWIFDAEMSLLYSVCMNTGQARRPYLLGIFLSLPMIPILLLTILIDWKCHQSAKKFRQGNLRKQRSLPFNGIMRTDKNVDFLKFLGQEAPMRSTIINIGNVQRRMLAYG